MLWNVDLSGIGAWRSLVAHLLWEQRVACSNAEQDVRARIYQPAKTAMQSGRALTKRWVLEFEPESGRTVEPLMGWTSSSDMRSQVVLEFDSKEEAIAYADKQEIPYQLFEPHLPKSRPKSYSDNFRFDRKIPWTH